MIGEPNKAKTGVFWNMDDCPIPGGLDTRKIFENIKLSLANESCGHGEVSMRAYCEKKDRSIDDLSLVDITFVPAPVNQLTRFKQILVDMYLWVAENRVYHRETKVLLISNIPQDGTVSALLHGLSGRGYTVLLAVPDSLAYVNCVWLWPSLTNNLKTIDHQSGSSDVNNEKKPHVPMTTGVFWNIDGCRILEGLNPPNVVKNIKSALTDIGCHGDVSILPYTDKYEPFNQFVFFFSLCGITLQNRVLKDVHHRDDSEEVDQMLVDIVLWALDNPAPSNLLLISKDISEEMELLRFLGALESKGYNILVAQTEEAASAVLHGTESSNLHLNMINLFGGGNPIDQSGSTLGVPDKGKKLKHREVCNTMSAFWNIEDCPIPGCFDPLMFVQLIKTAIANHGYHGEVSISAYCEKNRSLDDFSPTDIRFVPAGEKSARCEKMFNDILLCALENKKASNVMLITRIIPDHLKNNVLLPLEERDINLLFAQPRSGYAKSVWLWPSLAGGGNCVA